MTEVIIGIIGAALALLVGFFAGRGREQKKQMKDDLQSRRFKDAIKKDMTDEDVVRALTDPDRRK